MENMKRSAGILERAGRGGDTMLAHINPEEAQMLKAMGGSGTINPKTGLPEFLKIFGKKISFKKVRDAVESIAVVAGSYFLPGSSTVTSNLVSKGSQKQLDSTLGKLATIGASMYGAMDGNLLNYGKYLTAVGLEGMGSVATDAATWVNGVGSDLKTKATELWSGTSTGDGSQASKFLGSGVETSPTDTILSKATPTWQTGSAAGDLPSSGGLGIKGALPPVPADKGILGNVWNEIKANPLPSAMIASTVASGIGGMGKAQADIEAARIKAQNEIDAKAVKGGWDAKNPIPFQAGDPNKVTDMQGRYIRGPLAGQYAPGRAPGILQRAGG